MEVVRVLVANELRSYREAISGVIECLRPDDVEVRQTGPEELDREVDSFLPDMVVCSRTTCVVEERVPVWIELHPDHEASSRVSLRGQEHIEEDLNLDGILALLDSTREDGLAALNSG